METNLIVIKQLPVIEDQLMAVKQNIEKRVNKALRLVCTEETYKDIKKVRSDLNKEYQELEKRRKEVKAQILKPYESFESIYKECAGDIYARADEQLKTRIAEVENGLKLEKAEELAVYFAAKREELGIEKGFVDLEATGVRVGLSDSKTALHKKADEFLERIASDLQVISTLEHQDEVLAEYRHGYNLSAAMLTVDSRHKAIEAERVKREASQGVQKTEPEKAEESKPEPAPIAAPKTPKFTVTLRITARIDSMNLLKRFMEENDIAYERVKEE